MKITILGTFAILLFQPQIANANCMYGEEIDLRKSESGIFENITIRDQGNYGICYAHAASTLIDFIRNKKKSDRYAYADTDPMAAAILSTSIMEEMDIEGGQICEVVDGLKKAGFGCSNSGVNVAQVKGFGSGVHLSLINTVFMPYVLKQKEFVPVDPKFFGIAERKKNAKLISKEQKEYLKNMDAFLKIFFAELTLRNIPRSNLPDDTKLFEFFQNVYVKNRWASLEADVSYLAISRVCESNKFAMPSISCSSYSNSQFGMIDVIDDGLRRGYPTGASICSKFLSDKNYKGVKNSPHKSDCGEHAVVVIGKRYQNGFCQYLIRNSWGAGHQYAWPSSNGDIWVDEFALSANMYEAQVVR